MKFFVYAVIAIVAVAIIAGFFVVGSPNEARLLRFDEQRVSHLQSLQWEIVNYWQSKEKLPETLENLRDDIRGFIPPRDPATNEPYGYSVDGPLSFSLCATFARPSLESASTAPRMPQLPIGVYKGGGIEENWQHDAGLVCFKRTIDPDFFPPKKNRS